MVPTMTKLMFAFLAEGHNPDTGVRWKLNVQIEAEESEEKIRDKCGIGAGGVRVMLWTCSIC